MFVDVLTLFSKTEELGTIWIGVGCVFEPVFVQQGESFAVDDFENFVVGACGPGNHVF